MWEGEVWSHLPLRSGRGGGGPHDATECYDQRDIGGGARCAIGSAKILAHSVVLQCAVAISLLRVLFCSDSEVFDRLCQLWEVGGWFQHQC